MVHGNIKLENVLCMAQEDPFDEMVVKLTDFALASHFDSDDQSYYQSPELVLLSPVDGRIDTWAIGVLTYILLCKVQPFDAEEWDELSR